MEVCARFLGVAAYKTYFMFQRNILLKRHSNYKIGGPAAYFAEPKSVEEVIETLLAWRKVSKSFPAPKRQVFILGGGTNILFSDEGFAGLVLKPKLLSIKKNGNCVTAGSGVSMDDLLAFTAKNNLGGLEWAGGLPGTLGGAIRGNAGAFGGEIKDSLLSVKSLDYSGVKPRLKVRRNKECRFGYRDSIFKHNEEIILEASFALKKADSKEIKRIIEEKKNYRKERQPIEYPNVGSIFKNVPLRSIMKANHLTEAKARARFLVKEDPFPVVPTARLISECGLKGMKSGGAMVSEKHANFIVNVSKASSNDVKKLIQKVKKEVYKKFKVKLEEEVLVL